MRISWVIAIFIIGLTAFAGKAEAQCALTNLTACPSPPLNAVTAESMTLATPLAISSGGTGATTSGAALTALGAIGSASPNFTGTPTAPTAASCTSTTQLATTAYVLGNGCLVTPNLSGLEAISTATVSTVYRGGYATVGDGGQEWYYASGGACTLHSGAGDNGSQVPSANGKCWIAAFPATGADIRAFGAAVATTNNSVAIQNWANYACTGKLIAPQGVFKFTAAPIVFPACNGGSVQGSGMYGTTFMYSGASTTPDLFDFGAASNTGSQVLGWTVDGINVDSQTQMTAGTAIHLIFLVASTFNNVNAAGQYGNGGTSPHTWNGVWCDYCFDVYYNNFEASGANDGVRASGTVSATGAGFYPSNCKISGSAIGWHQGGNYGAMNPTNCDIIANVVNVEVDHSIVAAGNSTSIFDSATDVDTPISGSNIILNDSSFQSGQMMVFNGTWSCSALTGAYGLWVENMNGQKVIANFGAICNNQGGGIRIDDASANVSDNNGPGIYENGGYGIDATVVNNHVYVNGTPIGNSTGPWTADAILGTVGGCTTTACYTKDFSGTITQYFQANFTGAASTALLNTPSYPITFPNAVISGTLACVPYGINNTNALMGTGAAIAPGLSSAEIFLVSSVTVTNSQPVICQIKGN